MSTHDNGPPPPDWSPPSHKPSPFAAAFEAVPDIPPNITLGTE